MTSCNWSGFLNRRRLTPQGSAALTGMLNLGYRHKFSDRLSLLVSAQDVLGTFRDRLVLDTPTLKDTIRRGVNAELVFVGLSWTFGGGRARDPGSDFPERGRPAAMSWQPRMLSAPVGRGTMRSAVEGVCKIGG